MKGQEFVETVVAVGGANIETDIVFHSMVNEGNFCIHNVIIIIPNQNIIIGIKKIKNIII